MSIKTWFDGLRKSPRKVNSGFDKVEYYERNLKEELESNSSTRLEMAKYHGEKLVAAYREENKTLWWMLAYSLKERKTPSQEHVVKQLDAFKKALTAAIQCRMKGISYDNEMAVVIENALSEEHAKLLYLFFDNIDLTVEDAEKRIAEYKERIAKELAEANS